MIQIAHAYLVRKGALASIKSEAWTQAAAQYATLRQTGQARTSDVVRETRALEKAGFIERALVLHDENVALFPLSFHVRRQRAMALLRQGQNDLARLELAQARVLVEDDKAQEKMMVTELERLGVSEVDVTTVALAAFHAAPSPQPRQPGRLNRFRAQRIARAARSLRQAGDWASAIAHHDRVLDLYPHNGAIHVRQGHALKALARPFDAELAYWKGVALAPTDPDSYLQLGHALKLNRSMAAALPAYLLANAIQPGYQDLDGILNDYHLPENVIAQWTDAIANAEAKSIVGASGLLTMLGSGAATKKDIVVERARSYVHGYRHPLPRHIEVRAAAIAGDVARLSGASA